MEAEEDKVNEEEGYRYIDTSRGAPVEVVIVGGGMSLPEENADLPDFTPELALMLLREVYGDFPHHDNWSHLDGGVADDALWQHCWRRLATQSARCCATPSRAVGRCFAAILAEKWRGGT